MVPSAVPGLVRCSSATVTWPETPTASALIRRVVVSLARPKSSIFTWPELVTKILAGLISRWVIPFECAASSASAIWAARSRRRSNSERLAVDQVLQGIAFHQLHDDKRTALLFADFVNGADIGVIQGGGRLRLSMEALKAAAIARTLGEKLQRDSAAKASIFRLVDNPHPPTA